MEAAIVGWVEASLQTTIYPINSMSSSFFIDGMVLVGFTSFYPPYNIKERSHVECATLLPTTN
ncbi:MAG: hypothetical protein VSS75_004335 [Candidatus Parabeggiatoa sp.]|nr:hypothetical protein [Candidatus Parabeggiatoa sp.]